MLYIQKKTDGVIFKVYIQPKASKNSISGLHDDALKIRLTAPPVDGAANKMCIQFLSKQLGIPKSDIEIVSGQTSRTKHIFVRCVEGQTDKNPSQKVISKIDQLISTKRT